MVTLVLTSSLTFECDVIYGRPLKAKFLSTLAFKILTLLVFLMNNLRRVKMGDEVLAWLSVWSEVQMICIWSS